jgi:autotransporter adhesin
MVSRFVNFSAHRLGAPALGVTVAAAIFLGTSREAKAQVTPLVDICTGLRVSIPVLQPVNAIASGLLAGLLDPVLNTLVGNINTNIQVPLSGQTLSVTAVDGSGNAVSFPGSNCNVGADSVTVKQNKGITLGGGQIDGLGGVGNPVANAGEINAIALGNGANTAVAAASAIAMGLRANVAALDGIAIGRDSNVLASGSVALGAGAVANRSGMGGASEAFSGFAVTSTAGAVSVGASGGERQITNVAGGTQATDAVNVRQLFAVGSNLASSLGGGASFDPVTGSFTGPTYVIDGNNYNDVGSALAAITSAMGSIYVPVAANNTGGYAAPTATGSDALAVGYGASAAGAQSTAIGLNASANAIDGIAIGRDTSALASGGVALGAGAVANRSGMSGASEAFSGFAVTSTAGAVSVGASGAERQITNVAGGTQATDAVNVRQLFAVGSNLASSLGGGASFDPTTGVFTGPTYVIDGNNYSDVASALAAITSTIGTPVSVPVAANNTSSLPAPTATGADALAVGYGASAAGAQSTAIGQNATASYANSVAIGAGATTTQANQIALGTEQNTYRLAGIGSAQSSAAQTGPVRFVTSDASGNLALSTFDPGNIDARILAANYQIESVRREARQGIAAAMTMTSAPLPSQPGRTSWAVNAGTFQGEFATAFAMAYRFDTAKPLAVTAGYSNSGGTIHGARVGFAGEF